MNSKHLTLLLAILSISITLVKTTQIGMGSNRSVAFDSMRIVRRDLRAPPIQHVYPRVNKSRQFSAQHQSIQTVTTSTQNPHLNARIPTQQSQMQTDCACPEIFNPICGSDEKTYSNVCAFTCEKRKQPSVGLRIIHRGECTP